MCTVQNSFATYNVMPVWNRSVIPKNYFVILNLKENPWFSLWGILAGLEADCSMPRLPRTFQQLLSSPDTRRRPTTHRRLERWAPAPQAHNIYSLKDYKWWVRTATVSSVRHYKCLTAEQAGSEAPGQLRCLVLSHLAMSSQPKTPYRARCIPYLGSSDLFSYKYIPKWLLYKARRLSHLHGSEVTN